MDADVISTLSVPEVRTFLRSNGWQHHVSDDQEWDVFTLVRNGMEKEARVVLPRDYKADSRFEERRIHRSIRGTIETVAGLFEEDPASVVDAIRREERDVLRIRFPILNGEESIPLADLDKHVRYLKSLVAYATAAIEDARPFYSNWRGRMREMTNHFRFGHTFAGSFGLSIENPIRHKPKQLKGLFGKEQKPSVSIAPFEHRVMERIARGLTQVDSAVQDGGADRLVEEYREGVNANMCEQLAQSIKRTPGGITYGFEWAKHVDIDPSLSQAEPIRLSQSCVPILERASKQLRRREPEDVEIVGRVVQLASREPTRLGSQKSIRIEVADESDETPSSVIVDVGRKAYETALECHRLEKFVRVSGRLTRSGNFWHLTGVQDLEEWKPRQRG